MNRMILSKKTRFSLTCVWRLRNNRLINNKAKLSSIHTWPVNRVRREFIDFFHLQHNHTVMPFNSTVPANDPSILFVNSGMVQFKPLILGASANSSKYATIQRAVNSQRCIRIGGKHNDLSQVGLDTYHHTCFEMLGNWSFGDYSKQECCEMSLQLLLEVFNINPDRLYFTYFNGDQHTGMKADEATKYVWRQLSIPDCRILPSGYKDNFWEMGSSGPCGFCTEIHYDIIGNRDASMLVNSDDPSVIELWNLVFMEFNRLSDGSLVDLPMHHIDTGMGLERLLLVLQGATSSYDTDLFKPVIDATQQDCVIRPYRGGVGNEDSDGVDTSYRIVADHLRFLINVIADGEYPGPRGRGHVITKVIKRLLYAAHKLQLSTEKLCNLVDISAATMGESYPKLSHPTMLQTVKHIIIEEMTLFSKSIEKSKDIFFKTALINSDVKIYSGKSAFALHRLYGCPLEVTQLFASQLGLTVDEDGFENELQKQRQQTFMHKDKGQNDSYFGISNRQMQTLKDRNIQISDNSFRYLYSIDDDCLHIDECSCTIQAILNNNSIDVNKGSMQVMSLGMDYAIVCDKSPFYPIGGGQVSDIGTIVTQTGYFIVNHVREIGGYIFHYGFASWGELQVGEKAQCCIDTNHRLACTQNHTATHLLHAAISNYVGGKVEQHGSLIDQDKLRFDFSTTKRLSMKEITTNVEGIVNKWIIQSLPLEEYEVATEEALQSDEIVSSKNESYDDVSRLITINSPQLQSNSSECISAQLCCGTHVRNTSSLGAFLVTFDRQQGKHVQRITAVTGKLANDALNNAKHLESEISSLTGIVNSLVLTVGPVNKDDILNILQKVQQFEKTTFNVYCNFISKTRRLSFMVMLEGLKKTLKSKLSQYETSLYHDFKDTYLHKLVHKYTEIGSEDVVFLEVINIYPSMKHMTQVFRMVTAQFSSRPVMLCASRPEVTDKILIQMIIPGDRLQTQQWCKNIADEFGGKQKISDEKDEFLVLLRGDTEIINKIMNHAKDFIIAGQSLAG